MTSSHIRAIVFDAYGTCFDVHSAVARHAAELGPVAAALSDLWRAKQLEYTWTRSLMGHYRDFADVTEAALDFVMARFGVAKPDLRKKLLDAYLSLTAYPEVPGVLADLRAQGLRTAILSNGSPAMLASAVSSAGIAPHLDAVISVHPLGVFKPPPEAYQPVLDQLGVSKVEVLFISSNRWDVAGATAFGLASLWCNRSGQPEEYPDLAPRAVIGDLRGIAMYLASNPH
jgi:2-haloacid dehalogenase